MAKKFSWEMFLKLPVIGIARNIPFKDLKQIMPVFCAAGLNSIEITMNSVDSEDQIKYVAEKYGDRINVGAGTVCNLFDLEKALIAGAQFIVTPILNEGVISACVDNEVSIFSGAFTLTEIYKAWSAGADMVKVFPSSLGGPGYIKEIKAPLNKIRLMPTGGVSVDNCADFLEAGADALGMGSQLFSKQDIKEGNWEALKAHFINVVEKVSSYKTFIDQ